MTGEFWMDGFFGQNPVHISDSLESLADELVPESLYAVMGTFEGQWRVMRFDDWSEVPFKRGAVGRSIHHWNSTLDQDHYIEYLDEIKSEIEKGWVYQVNACRMLSTKDPLNLESLFSLFHDHHPAPAAGYWRCEKWEIASASPETFFRVDVRDRKRRITTSPIKGTSKDRNFAKKDSAENVMIVDLMRNDISPLCEPSSVVVPRLLDVEEHPGLFHLVSDVSGQLKTDITWSQLLKRMTPAGSISGAPKSSALEVIKRFEKYRGPYCGTLGWIQNGKAHFSVLIRTFFKDFNVDPEVTYFGTGAGITWGSEPVAEWQETVLKAERLMEIADRT